MNTTKTAQFTPGPWVVDEDYEDEEQQAIGIVKEGHGYIAGIHILASCNNGEGFTAEDRANAALIAAAPAMYGELSVSTNLLCRALPYLPEAVAKELVKQRQINMQVLSQAEGRHHE